MRMGGVREARTSSLFAVRGKFRRSSQAAEPRGVASESSSHWKATSESRRCLHLVHSAYQTRFGLAASTEE